MTTDLEPIPQMLSPERDAFAKRELTDLQYRWLHFVLLGHGDHKAAELAGYAVPHVSSRLCRRHPVIQALLTEGFESVGFGPGEVIQGVFAIFQDATQTTRDRLGAAKLLGSWMGLEKRQFTVEHTFGPDDVGRVLAEVLKGHRPDPGQLDEDAGVALPIIDMGEAG